MKEPDLEEEALRARSVGVTMTSPDGSTRTIDLKQTSPGLRLGVIDVDKPGL